MKDYALAKSESRPFAGTEKDDDFDIVHLKTNFFSRDIWLKKGTLQYLKDKSFSPKANAGSGKRFVHIALRVITSQNSLLK